MRKMKTLRTEEILEIEKIFIENGDVDEFQSHFPLEIGDVVVHYKKHEDGITEELGINLVSDVYPSVINGIFLDSVYESRENYYTDNTDGKFEDIVNQYLEEELIGGEKYFSEHEGIWEKFQEATDKREFIRNLFKKEA